MSSRIAVWDQKPREPARPFYARRLAVNLLVTLVFILGSCVYPRIDKQSPREKTEIRLRAWHGAIQVYNTTEGQLPDSLEMVCELDALCEVFSGNDRVLDAWGQRIAYVPADGDFELSSPGEDRRVGTDDDMVFSSVEERDRVSRVAGCYSVVLDWWHPSLDNHLRLDTIPAVGGWYRLLPDIPYHLGVWAPVTRDSVVAFWVEVDTGLAMYLTVRGDSLVGRGTDRDAWRPIEAIRVACH